MRSISMRHFFIAIVYFATFLGFSLGIIEFLELLSETEAIRGTISQITTIYIHFPDFYYHADCIEL